MKNILMFTLKSCPYCRQAHAWMAELIAENPEYGKIEISIVDEGTQPDIANQYNYYYVPTYYVGNRKMHEGAATKDKVRAVFEAALR